MNLGFTRWYLLIVVHALSGCAGIGGAMVGTIATGILLGGSIPGVSRPVDYHGQAEKEIKSGKYDPKLWAEALVLVDGDEEKRYAKYIELRAEQLSRENEASKSKPDQYEESALFTSTVSDVQPALNDQSELISDLKGTYGSDIQGDPPWMFRDRKPMFTFEQSGNDIIGTNISKNGSKIIGIRNGDTIKFKYWGAHRLILGEWKINPDGTSLEGTWEAENEHGSWNLTRIE